MERLCEHCGSVFQLNKEDGKKIRRFCSRRCSSIAWYKNWKSKNGWVPRPKVLGPSAVGALNEMLVISDLINKGHEVYRAISAGSPCDLVIVRDTDILRVEVTTGRNSPSGKYYVPNGKRGKTTHDVLAVVLNGKIIYEPAVL